MASKKEKLRAAGFILFHRKGGAVRWLALKNSRHGTWGFPKGRLKPGEDDDEAARRELAEETGLKEIRIVPGFVREISYKVADSAGNSFDKTVVYRLAGAGSAGVTLSPEHGEYRWLGAEDMEDILQYANLRAVFRDAADFLEASGASEC